MCICVVMLIKIGPSCNAIGSDPEPNLKMAWKFSCFKTPEKWYCVLFMAFMYTPFCMFTWNIEEICSLPCLYMTVFSPAFIWQLSPLPSVEFHRNNRFFYLYLIEFSPYLWETIGISQVLIYTWCKSFSLCIGKISKCTCIKYTCNVTCNH